jgi:hypothetical protein
MVYPQWGLYVLEQNPRLSLGLPLSFFLLAAAFVEFSLGYLLIINLLQRPLALVITLVFFTTTLVFGKVEVIGHTPIHAALVVFLLEGPGRVYRPPIALHRGLGLRTAFAAVNFALLLTLLFVPYTYGAARLYRENAAHALRTGVSARPGATNSKRRTVRRRSKSRRLSVTSVTPASPQEVAIRASWTNERGTVRSSTFLAAASCAMAVPASRQLRCEGVTSLRRRTRGPANSFSTVAADLEFIAPTRSSCSTTECR